MNDQLKIAFLFPRRLWESKMDPNRRYAIEAIRRLPNVVSVLSGYGWDNWDTARDVDSNVQRLLPKCDLIVWYKPVDPKHGPLTDAADHLIPACAIYNDCWSKAIAEDEIRDSRTNLVICHQDNDRARIYPIQKIADWPMQVTHIPHGVEWSVFENVSRPWHERDIPVLLTGCHSPQVYPLRAKFREMIKRGLVPGVIREHPGYDVKIAADGDRQYREYAEQLGRAKIALVCSSRYKYALSKFPEAAAAGCYIVGDRPEGRWHSHISMETVSADDSVEDLADTINGCLEDIYGAKTYARENRELIQCEYTFEHYAERFVAVARDFVMSVSP